MFADPEKNIKQFVVPKGGHVADFGAGSGAYALAAAKEVGPDGRVYAIDIQQELLSRIKSDAKLRRISNIEIIWGNVEEYGGSKLRDSSMDAVIASNIFFQVENKQELVKEITRVLRSGGRTLIVDWSDSFGGLGPRPDMIIRADSLKDLCKIKGLEFEKDIDAGTHHYGLIFKKR